MGTSIPSRSIVLKSSISRFGNTLGVLIGAGVPLVEALNVSGQVADNKIICNFISKAEEKVKGGQSLNKSLGVHKIFPQIFIQMIAARKHRRNFVERCNR